MSEWKTRESETEYIYTGIYIYLHNLHLCKMKANIWTLSVKHDCIEQSVLVKTLLPEIPLKHKKFVIWGGT